MNNYNLSEIQSDAILKMKLSNLTHLEIEKLENEKNEKIEKSNEIKEILSSEEKIKQEMIKDISNISKNTEMQERQRILILIFLLKKKMLSLLKRKNY